MNLHKTKEIYPIIKECIKGKRRAENQLYQISFPYAMGVAMRYSNNRENSVEIVNEAFSKAFMYLEKFDPSFSFAYWLRRIVINTAIDHYHVRKQAFENNYFTEDEHFLEIEVEAEILDQFEAEEILHYIQQLPPAYRIVFSLYAIEGYTHKEISSQLGITEGTSKSNYFKAKQKLQAALIKGDDLPHKKINI